jgi:lipoprotein-releasing system ATP-binding protein
MDSKYILELKNITKRFKLNDSLVLNNIDFNLEFGKKVAIIGQSGSGKSTLLSIAGGIYSPDSGEVIFDGKNLNKISNKQKEKILNQDVGFLYQFHHLMPDFNSIENVQMASFIAGEPKENSLKKAKDLLDIVGLKDRFLNKPRELSGGERQRVAIARAMMNNPKCLFLDEPTGNLDNKNTQNFYQVIHDLSEEFGSSVVIVTHDDALANEMDIVYKMNDGKLITVK